MGLFVDNRAISLAFLVCLGAVLWAIELSFLIGQRVIPLLPRKAQGGVCPERDGTIARVGTDIQLNLQ